MVDARRAEAVRRQSRRLQKLRTLFVSVASVWEFEIKSATGRLSESFDFLEVAAALRCEIVSIEAKDAIVAARLPPIAAILSTAWSSPR